MARRQKSKEYTITISTSSKFLDKLPYIKRKIESVKEGSLGPVRYHVLMPDIKKFKSLEDISVKDLQYYFLEQQFRNIEKSDALYIYNPSKDGKLGHSYIGGNSFLLMGKAFDEKIPIWTSYLYSGRHCDNCEDNILEEIELVQPIIIGTIFKNIDYLLSKEYHKDRKAYQIKLLTNILNSNYSLFDLANKLN